MPSDLGAVIARVRSITNWYADAEHLVGANVTCADLRALLAALDEAQEALRPFAAMHREGTDPNELACARGYASDQTCIWSGDFARAARAVPPTREGA